MSWKKLSVQDVRMSLAEDELERLQTLSTKLDDVVQDTVDMVSDAFRAAWAAKGYTLDVREHYIDQGYAMFVLAVVRWQLWTRFPMSENYALSEPRKTQYEQAVKLMKDPYLATTKPDYSDDPELSGKVFDQKDDSITVPYLRFPSFPLGE